jgi:hypothetical protein
MKRTIICAVILCTVVFPSLFSQVIGDANGDGSVTIVDALRTAQY